MSTAKSNAILVDEAITRLLRGESRRTDGRLTLTNLAAEAGLTRQQVHRTGLVDRWNRLKAEREEADGAPADANLAEITRLKELLAREREIKDRYRHERDEARTRASTLANVVRIQDGELAQLERQLQRTGRVVALRARDDPPASPGA